MDSTDTGTAMDAAAWPIFGLLTAIALSALFAPRVYTPIADVVLRIAGVDERLRSLDEAIEDTLRLEELAAIGARSRDMIGRVRDLLGGGAEDEVGGDGLGDDAGATSGDSGSGQVPEAGSEPPGLVESAMRPLLVDTLALMIRALAFAGSLAGMLALVTVRMATRATRAAGRSRARIEALEARIAALETRRGGPAER